MIDLHSNLYSDIYYREMPESFLLCLEFHQVSEVPQSTIIIRDPIRENSEYRFAISLWYSLKFLFVEARRALSMIA